MNVQVPAVKLHCLCGILLCLLPALLAVQAAEPAAARVQFVVGNVSATSTDGTRRQLNKGDRLYEGDTVQSGDNGAAQIIYRDRSRMAVRVNTTFKIDVYEYENKDGSGGSSVFSLLSGALRAVSGLIGSANRENVTIKTPLATIGIRGTDHEVVHIDPSIGRPIAEPGTYNKVYLGATEILTSIGKLDINLRETGYVGGTPGDIKRPVQIPDLPQAIKSQIIEKVPVQARRTVPQQPASGATGRAQSKAGNTASNQKGAETAKPATASGLQSMTPSLGNINNRAFSPNSAQTLSPANSKGLAPASGSVLNRSGGLSVPSTTLEKTLTNSPGNLLNSRTAIPSPQVDPGVNTRVPTEAFSKPSGISSKGIAAPKIDPAVKQPINIEPVIKQPITIEPVIKQPVVTEPVIREPVVTEPLIKEPINIQGIQLPGTTTIRQ